MIRIINQMPAQLRAIVGVFVGVAVGFAAMMFFRGLLAEQPPEGVTIQNIKAYNLWTASLSTQAYLYLLAAFCGAALIAGAVTGYFVLHTRYKIACILSGFLLLILTIGNFLAFNHPEWLTVGACTGFVAFAWIGGWFIRLAFEKNRNN
ncbi:MAG: hypothetical protein RIR11_4629 [Bacteroidota bacterium]|jgi:hypothetical protein